MFEELQLVGLKHILILATVGGLIAYIADKLGSRIGKARVTFFGLRPRQSATVLTIVSGVVIALLSVTVMAFMSENARVALFGMEQISKELRVLEKERDMAAEALADAKRNVDKQQQVIQILDRRIKDGSATVAQAKSRIADAQKQVTELNEAKEKLAGEIVKLEQNTKILKDGITAMREGELFYHSGEVVYAGVMRSGLNREENVIQLNWLLRMANEAALSRLGVVRREIETEQVPQAVAVQQKTMDAALSVLSKATTNMFFRVRALTNVMVGEVAPCSFEMVENRLIYADGTVVCREEYNLPHNVKGSDGVMMDFLRKINHESVQRGVLPDPITGNVGGMDTTSALKVSNQLRKAGKHFVVEAKADGDIYTSGPVRVLFNVAKVVEE